MISSARIRLRLFCLFYAFCLFLQLFTLFIFFYTSLHLFTLLISFYAFLDVSLSDRPYAYLSFEFQHFCIDSNEKTFALANQKLICQAIYGKEISPFINFRMYKNKKTPIVFSYWCQFLKVGRDTGVEPVHARFTAECVHRFTNRATRI